MIRNSTLLLFVLSLFFTTHFTQSQGLVPEMMYYRFDGTGANVINEASTPVGTLPASILGTGLTQGGIGQFGGALNGASSSSLTDYLNTGWVTNLSGDWTISMWVNNVPQTTTLYYQFGDPAALSFRCFAGGVAGAGDFLLRGGGLTDILATTLGASATGCVIHFVYDNSVPEVRAYVNGVLNNTVPQPTITVSGTGPFKIGGYSTSNGIDGQLDEFRMYNRALSQTEITDTWNNELPLSSGVPEDIGATGILPFSNTFCPGVQNVDANINNFGTSIVTTFTVNWSLDGVLQTPVTSTVTLDTAGGTGSTNATVTLGTNNFVNGQTYNIEAWTTMPNGIADTITVNDSVTSSIATNIPAPTTLVASNVTTSTADLGWAEIGTAMNWEIEVGVTGFSLGTGFSIFTNTNPNNLTGLTASTTYDYYVRSICGAGDTSAWSTAGVFTTVCTPSTIPYSQDFDGVVAPAMPGCWAVIAPGQPVQTVTSTDHGEPIPSGPNCLEINDGNPAMAISPEFTNLGSGLNQVRVKIACESTNFTDTLYIGVMADQTNAASFVPLYFVENGTNGTTTFTEHTFPLTNTALIGSNSFVAFSYRTSGGGWEYFLDDFFVEQIPGSVAPIANFTYSNSSGTTFDFTDASANVPSTWLWTFGDGNNSGIQNPSHTYASTGNFDVTLTVSNALGIDDTTISIAVSGLNSSLLDNVTVYPNPTDKTLHIKVSNEVVQGYSILNMMGQEVLISENQIFESREIDVSGLAPGTYLLKLNFGDEFALQRISIQR